MKRLFDSIKAVGMQRQPLVLRRDGLIVFALFVIAASWGFAFWKRVSVHGQPFYYQLYFEPAVMVACGKGFVVARPQVPEMVTFLRQQTDRFACDAIPPNAPLGTEEVFQQGSWRYLMLAVGFTWRIFGVAWSALGPLFAFMFGATIAAAYLIFRLGTGPLLSVTGALALTVSRIHLKFLPALRDYAKAPMTLVLFVLLGALIVGRVGWRRTLAIAALYGATLGFGYGFRSDFLAYLPPFFITVAMFTPGGILKNLPIKATAVVVCLITAFVAAWPVISTLAKSKPGCQWHVVILGFARQFDRPLGVEPAPYEFGREYLDEWAYTTVTSYAARLQPRVGHIEYCEVAYGEATRDYLADVIHRFPADLMVRGYASALRVVELPFLPVEGWDDDDGRELDWDAGHRRGFAVVLAALLVIAAVDLRIGLFLVFALVYFGALPAIQFGERHFFHFEFMPWFAALFLVQSGVTDFRPLSHDHRARQQFAAALARSAIVLCACAVVLVAALWAARAYQQPTIRALLSAYVTAPRDQISAARLDAGDQQIRVAPRTDPESADFVVVDVNQARCGDGSAVAFRYDDPRRPYGRVFSVAREPQAQGLTQIFMPIYDGFRRLEFVDAPPGCVDGVYRVRDPQQFSLLLEVQLPADWRRQPLYQRLPDRLF